MPNFSRDNILPTLVRRLRGAAAVVFEKRTEYNAHLAAYRPRTPFITPQTPLPLAPANSYRIAMISEISEDEVIVVSALAAAPFCCHADLLTMSALELIAVARVLNDALPLPLHINLNAEANRQPGEIRAEIETIVGLRSRRQPVTSARVGPWPSGLSQFHLEPPVTYHGRANGDPFLEDTNYDGDISMSSRPAPKRRLRTSARRTVCAPTTPQFSPSPVVFDTDKDTSPSLVKSSRRRRWGMGQVSLQGFTVEEELDVSSSVPLPL